MTLLPGTRLGVYEIAGVLGAGGMGEVYRARDSKLGRDVAVKILPELFRADPERVARFEREARTLATLNHPNIGHIYGFEQSGDIRGLVLELVEGPSLADRLAQGPIPIDEALAIARQIAEGLEAAHEQGIVHRDLKPANIKVRGDGTVKVLDFGLAKALTGPSGASSSGATSSPTITSPLTMTGVGVLLGTATYMAPEQARGKPTDKRADIWAFGCVMFEMLTGRRAFDGETVTDALSAVVSQEPAWTALPRDTPAQLHDLLERCLVKDPRQRLRDIGDARILLTSADGRRSSQSSGNEALRGRLVLAGWTVAALATLAAGLLWFRPSPQAAVLPSLLQLSVELPSGLLLTGGGDLAMSPDGTQVALRANDGSGDALWLLDLKTNAVKRLAGTDGTPTGTFWSPDGTSLGYFRFDVLRAVDLATGTSRTVCPIPQGSLLLGSWNQQGQILFGGPFSPLYQVSAAGGTPLSLTTLDSGEFGHSNPIFLPDGNRFLYMVKRTPNIRATKSDQPRLATLDDPRGVTLQVSGRPKLVAPDILLTLSDGVLSGQRLDVETRTLRGQPTVLPAVIQLFAGGYSFDANPTLLLFRNPESDRQRRLAWYDRTGRSSGEVTVPANSQGIEIAPDGSRVVFEVLEPGISSRDLWVATIPSGELRKVAFTDADESDAKWLSDSRTIVFGTRRGETSEPLMKLALDSTAPATPVAELAGANMFPASMSRDGRVLAVVRQGVPFWTAWPDPKPVPFPPSVRTPNARPRMSPDGRWFVYESVVSGKPDVYFEPLPPTGAPRPVSLNGGTWARWHPNGREIYFIAPDNTMMGVTFESTTDGSVRLGKPTRLFQTRIAAPTRSGVHANYDIAPDGRFLIVENIGFDHPASSLRVLVNWQSLLPAVR